MVQGLRVRAPGGWGILLAVTAVWWAVIGFAAGTRNPFVEVPIFAGCVLIGVPAALAYAASSPRVRLTPLPRAQLAPLSTEGLRSWRKPVAVLGWLVALPVNAVRAGIVWPRWLRDNRRQMLAFVPLAALRGLAMIATAGVAWLIGFGLQGNIHPSRASWWEYVAVLLFVSAFGFVMGLRDRSDDLGLPAEGADAPTAVFPDGSSA